MGDRVMLGSPGCYNSQMPRKPAAVPRQPSDMPGLLVTVSSYDAKEPVGSTYAEQPVTDELLSGGCGGGDVTRHTKPAPSSGSKKQLAPAVAQLFSSFSTPRRSSRDDVVELLDVHPQGIDLNNFCRVFEKCFHRPFDSRYSDVGSLRQMLEGMVDLVECVEHGDEVIVRRKHGTDYFQGNASQL